MPLDPQARALLDQVEAADIPPISSLSVPDAREARRARRALVDTTPEPIQRVEDRTIPGPVGELAVRVYTPTEGGGLPILVYFHGGGWVVGDLETHDPVCRGLANAGGCLVVSVDYRLAPEHTFPAAVEDALAATVWAAANAADLGGDGSRLAVGGDSAGGNLAAVVALMARDRGGPPLAHQLLIYPVTDFDVDTPSYHANADGYMLTRNDMIWFWDHYVPNEATRADPYAAPLRAPDFRGLPSAYVITAEYDPLCDEGVAYAARLREAGVDVVADCYPGMIHGFVANAAVLDAGTRAIQKSGQLLRAAFGS